MLAIDDATGLEQALNRVGDGICAVSPEGRVLFWNRAAERILGYSSRDVTGRPCCDVFAGHDEHGNRTCHAGCQVLTLVAMQEPVQHFDMLTRAKDGRAVWLDVSILALPRATSGTRPGSAVVLHVFRDVTANRELLDVVRTRYAPQPESPSLTAVPLSRRELEVLRLVAEGHRTKAVAERLHVSPATVRNHVQNILGKLGAHNRLEAVAYATRHRLL
jgi:PAS domain S-box-containing protein